MSNVVETGNNVNSLLCKRCCCFKRHNRRAVWDDFWGNDELTRQLCGGSTLRKRAAADQYLPTATERRWSVIALAKR